MKNIPLISTAKEFYDKHYSDDVVVMMKEFAKLHVEAALEAAANAYYPRNKENFELITERFLDAYPLTNIK
jgi:hypothetical protein